MVPLLKTITLTTKDFEAIVAHEKKYYQGDSRTPLLVAFAQKEGFLPDGEITVDYVNIYPEDIKMDFMFTDENGVEYPFIIENLLEETSLQPIFMLALTIGPAMHALDKDYDFDHIYSLAGILANRVAIEDTNTYPRYIPQIQPKHFDNFEYDTEDAQMLAMRFTYIGEQRTNTSLLRSPVIARYIVESSEKSDNNGFSEVYPVILHGNLVEFNGVIQFPHELIIPVDNETEIDRYKELGATFIDAVTVCDAGNVCWLDTVNGTQRPAY